MKSSNDLHHLVHSLKFFFLLFQLVSHQGRSATGIIPEVRSSNDGINISKTPWFLPAETKSVASIKWQNCKQCNERTELFTSNHPLLESVGLSELCVVDSRKVIRRIPTVAKRINFHVRIHCVESFITFIDRSLLHLIASQNRMRHASIILLDTARGLPW